MRINHNIAALNTHRQLSQANNANQQSMEKLSSGLRINRAGDDAAGLAISEKMRGQIRGLEQAQSNAQDGISMIQTAEGAMNESHSILQRMRELSVQSANDTNTDADRQELQKEVNQLSEELTRISNDTEFNSQKLLDGSFEGKIQIGANSDQNMEVSVGEMSADSLDVVRAATSAEQTTTSDSLYVDGADGSNIVGSGSGGQIASLDVSIDGGSGTTISFSGATTKSELVASINSGISGGTAELNSDGTISITSDSTGTTSSVTIDNLQEGQDSSGNAVTQLSQVFDDTAQVTGSDRDTSKGIDISSQETANAAIGTIDQAIQDVSAERSKLGAVQNRLDHTINNLGTSSENLTAAESRIRDVDMAKEMMNQTKQNILAQASQSMLAKANQQPQGVLQLLR